jgi:hypothetical protein
MPFAARHGRCSSVLTSPLCSPLMVAHTLMRACLRFGVTEAKDSITRSKEWDQVQKDVERSLWRFTQDPDLRQAQRVELSRLINAVLVRNPSLHYFQGFHDVASVFLLVRTYTRIRAHTHAQPHALRSVLTCFLQGVWRASCVCAS